MEPAPELEGPVLVPRSRVGRLGPACGDPVTSAFPGFEVPPRRERDSTAAVACRGGPCAEGNLLIFTWLAAGDPAACADRAALVRNGRAAVVRGARAFRRFSDRTRVFSLKNVNRRRRRGRGSRVAVTLPTRSVHPRDIPSLGQRPVRRMARS